ncbi:unnamed protein product [Euphydryas editha]|uniref:Lipase n=1 Tax=Euphydryas editha TaxID=104508 RepID=A0AAU9TWE6_EUPED|nr:unnamed protein product [Euphydryas editha]
MLGTVVLLSCVVLAVGSRSPHADYIEELVRNNVFGNRVSNNILEDATLDLPDLVRKYKYPFEEHSVTTQDGYVLGLHRIPHGRDLNNFPSDKPVVFLMHGLLMSSADYITSGPGSALAYILADEGYDVWLGNARGNYFSRKHTILNPSDVDFWQFSWDEIGNIDLPAMIDYILSYTTKSALHYIGHSQGTTSFFVMCSLRPEYNEKIITMHALSPVAYMANNQNPLLLAIAPYSRDIASLASLIGVGEILPNREFYTWVGQTFCSDGSLVQPLCSTILFLAGGWNEIQHNATMMPVYFGHTPAGAAVMQFAHYGQGISEKEFRRYDFGIVQNFIKYGRPIPPSYDLSKVIVPVMLHYSERDPLAHVTDVERLFGELGGPAARFRVPQSTFSHIDFVWGIDAKSSVYDRIILLLKNID